MSYFKDNWNIQGDELIRWAEDRSADWPDQDFDIAVADLRFSEIIIRYATDDESPKRRFFLGCAYLIVGNSLKSTNQASLKNKEVESFLIKAKESNHKSMDLLCVRYEEVLNNQIEFNYELWCNQGFSNGKEN